MGGQATVEGHVESVEGLLPALGPPGPALAGRIQGHHGHVDALQSSLLVGKVAASLHSLADPGVHALNGVG